jgi:hypothetical protein
MWVSNCRFLKGNKYKMDAIGLINDLRGALKHTKNNGQSVVVIDRLEAYLNSVEPLANATNNHAAQHAARQKFEDDMEVYKLRSAYDLAMFNAVIEAGLTALKSALIINGGAAVALLAFIGGILGEPKAKTSFVLSDIGFALLMFLFGAGCAGTASGVRYLCQFFYAQSWEADHEEKPCKSKACGVAGGIFQIFSILLGVASFVLFFYGGWQAYIALIK